MTLHRIPFPGLVSASAQTLLRGAAAVLVPAFAYWLAARVGMVFLIERAGVSLLWPAAGVALALACRFGPLAAAGAALGALAAHLESGHDLTASVAVALGMGLAAWLGAALVARARIGFAMDRPSDVLGFLLAGALPSSIASSLFGAGVLWLAGIARWPGFPSLWWLCWVADLMGILLLAPALLVSRPRGLGRRGWLEAGVIAVLTLLAAVVVYGEWLPPDAMLGRPLSYLIFPLVIWAAMRLGPALTVWLLLFHAAIAAGFTAMDSGPFAHGALSQELLALHAHLAMVSLTGLLLAASIAGRRQAEERARAYLDELAHAGRVSAMGEMAAGLAHELNQPLCAIATYAQAARRLAGKDTDPTLVRALERLDDNARRAGGIIRQMRNFVRGGEPESERVSTNTLVREGLALTAAAVRQGGVTLRLRLDPDVPDVRVATVQIHQVLVNLVRNAVEALAGMPEARRRLEVTTARRADGRVEVTVMDTGPGIPVRLRDALFEPFVSGGGEGMGLGLSVSRSIIRHHGGELRFEDRPGGGCLFSFDLPAAGGRDSDG
ncbi:Adaptive-response sensory-kinase SasA [wastewater metagenome]|uniref:Adaptive-response sensory-kinase SasA n=4 Tax=root TaxID=1 RepID=A0A5B8R664_9ZZZZ|nr:ATP-binding protein [Arhodomonas aquaeolei]MCS4504918.1 MASE1 domain-containing protein [Arhodomonas aquaeolei]QEA04130.1 adaptive-response sensory-kinase SasA [uncultured organism]